MEIKIQLPNLDELPFIKIIEPNIVIAKNQYNGDIPIKRNINILVPQIKGIYFLYDKDKILLYIGETQNILRRLGVHKHRLPEAYYIKFFRLEGSKRYRIGVEQILIDKFKPNKLEIATKMRGVYRLIH